MFSVKESLIEELALTAHDFGVNCISVHKLKDITWVASGGDDQQISVMKLQDGKLDLLYRWYAHSSCIKGIGFYMQEQQLYVCSSGYD